MEVRVARDKGVLQDPVEPLGHLVVHAIPGPAIPCPHVPLLVPRPSPMIDGPVILVISLQPGIAIVREYRGVLREEAHERL